MIIKIAFDGFRLTLPVFSESDLVDVAEVGLASQKARIAAGVNMNDAPAKALSKGHRIRKLRHGLKPYRDLRFTGDMLDDLTVRESGGTSATIGFNSPALAQRAAFNQAIENMIGLSQRDEETMNRAAFEKLRRKFQRAA